MYAQFFGLRELPFNNTPDPRFFYSTPDHEEALALLIYAVSERKEFALLTGDIGAGKTLISRLMLRHFGSRIAHAAVNHAVRSGPDLLEVVCTEFGLNVPEPASQAHLTRSLHDYLLQQFARNTPVVLVLDEAQNLPAEAFEQLRMIGNLESDDAKLLQVIIVGQPELRHTIASPTLRQLSQRIFRSFHLPALTRSHTEGYIKHRLKVAGWDGGELFEGGAIDSIFAASDGLPRVINTLCDNALLSAYSGGRRVIDRTFMDLVIRQTQAPRAQLAANVTQTLDRRASWRSLPPTEAPIAYVPSALRVDRDVVASSASSSHQVASEDVSTTRMLVDEVLRRLDGVERSLSKATGSLADSRTGQADMAAVVTQARNVVARVDSACHELRQRELNIDRLVAASRTVLDELNRTLTDVRKTTAQTQHAQKSAHETADRLNEKIQKAQEALRSPMPDGRNRSVDGDRSKQTMDKSQVDDQQATRAVSRLDELLDEAHQRLGGLRTLGTQSSRIDHDRQERSAIGDSAPSLLPMNSPFDTRSRVTDRDRMPSEASNKLAANVEELLRFVESAKS